jgi:hypothetical protein
MKATGRNMELARAAIAAGDSETVQMRVARAREQLFPTVSFWRNRKDTEAVKLLRDAVATLDALDGSLSKQAQDVPAVKEALMKVDAACQRCHVAYREEDSASKSFRLKPRG